MSADSVDPVGRAKGAAVATPLHETIGEFAEGSGAPFDWSAFTKSNRKALQNVALEKFNLLSTFRDTWSDKLYKPQVFTADVEGRDTLWLHVDCDHGHFIAVFSRDGKEALASGFMPEHGESLSWEPGFVVDDYLEHEVVKSNATKSKD